MLPDQDSNLDLLNQNQSYYPYTIRQSKKLLIEIRGGAKVSVAPSSSKLINLDFQNVYNYCLNCYNNKAASR